MIRSFLARSIKIVYPEHDKYKCSKAFVEETRIIQERYPIHNFSIIIEEEGVVFWIPKYVISLSPYISTQLLDVIKDVVRNRELVKFFTLPGNDVEIMHLRNTNCYVPDAYRVRICECKEEHYKKFIEVNFYYRLENANEIKIHILLDTRVIEEIERYMKKEGGYYDGIKKRF